MEPQFSEKNIVIISSTPFLFSAPRIGEVVVHKFNNKLLLKRITKIKNGKYFLTGDNKSDSFDSRSFGEISKKDIIGKVILKIS